jgi:hypothetical protein
MFIMEHGHARANERVALHHRRAAKRIGIDLLRDQNAGIRDHIGTQIVFNGVVFTAIFD